ncbi:MAG: tetratricopeptide repeat protein [Clostridiales bacterium]|jgi:tetratricopeptide (TPR) repeat protein|nr:tetratricopeptide repeat protein [Clostridiales bacterium]
MFYYDEVRTLRTKLTARHRAGEYGKCVYIGEKLIQLHKKNKNTESMNFADDLYNLAIVYEETGRLNRAIDLYADSMRVVETVSGKGLDYAKRLTNLGVLYGRNGEHKTAMDFYVMAEDIVKRILGREHPDAVDALYNYASSLFDAGQYKKALKKHTEALERRRQRPETLDLADSINACGYCHEAMENKEKADRCFTEALSVTERVAGAQTEEYISGLMYYGGYLSRTDRLDEAAKSFDKAALLLKKTYSENHIYYAGALGAAAEVYEKLGNMKKSLGLRLKTIAIMEKAIGGNHLYFANSLKAIALGYNELGNTGKAITVMNKALRIKGSLMGRGCAEYTRDALLMVMFYLERMEYKKMAEILGGVLKHIDADASENPEFYAGIRDLCLLSGEMAKIQQNIKNPEQNDSIVSSDLRKAEAITDLLKRISERLKDE